MEIYKPNCRLLNDHGTDGSFSKWADELKIEKTPFALRWSKGKKQIIYVAAEHTQDPTSSTYKLISRLVKSYKPQIALIEGVNFFEGISPENIYLSGERQHVANLVNKFIGCEPDEEKIFRKSVKKYNISDIFGLVALRLHKYLYVTSKEPKSELCSTKNKL